MVARGRRVASAALSGLALGLAAATAAASATSAGPACAPAVADRSARLDGAVTVSPMPGATDATPQSQISFLGVPAGALTAIAVAGSRSGPHDGRLLAYSQGDGGSFVPTTPFLPGEVVTVTADVLLASGAQPLRYHFEVAQPDQLTTAPEREHAAPGGQQRFHSRPDLRPPIVSVHRSSSDVAPGDVFLAPYGVSAQAGPMIIAPSGRLVWFEPLPSRMVATNLRVQQLNGSAVLTWWQGTITHYGFGVGADEILGPDYRPIAVVKAGNGLEADLHEFQITPNGTALLTAYNPVRCNLAALGGAADGAVTDSLFQVIDIRTGLVRFQWTSLDHVPLSASYSPVRGSSTAWPYDFFHLNSVNLDPDGSLLISARNTWAVYEVDAATGKIRWTLGGRESSFVENPGATTAYQHDARPLGADEFTLFDNGASPQQHLQSRGVVLALDAQTGTVSRQLQFLHPGRRLLADSQGNLQALPDGHWLIGWGQEPDISEFGASGQPLFDASLPRGYESYRALRFPWIGTPHTLPALVVTANRRGATAYASWNGDTEITSWELIEGTSPTALVHVVTLQRSGFETAMPLAVIGAERFAAVRALDAGGAVLATSATVALPAGATG